jgi:uncharacterized protein (TIGR02145 family)
MKILLCFVLFIAISISIAAQVPVIKIYNADGSSKQYKIEDIETLNFIHSNLSYSMEIYNKNNLPKNEYDIRVIDSIRFENNIKMKVFIADKIFERNKDDIDSIIFVWNTCEEILIGNQVWMCRNLDVDHYRNGDSIPEVRDSLEWVNLTTGAWCYYNNNDSFGTIYGKLYNWYAVNDPRGLAPEGWHVPTNDEWMILVNYLGGANFAGGKLKEEGLIHWKTNKGGTNESGFTALPGSIHYSDNFRAFGSIGTNGNYWTSTEDDINTAWHKMVVFFDAIITGSGANNKAIGYSVRCIKNK